MACLQVIGTIYGRKFFLLFGFNASVGRVIFVPIVLYIFQIVSECYGWQYARQIIWCNFIVNGVLTTTTFAVKLISFAPLTHAGLENSYITLMDTMRVSSVSTWITMFVADYVTSSLIAWSHKKFLGKFMFFRIMSLHILSELILLLSNLLVMPYNGYTIHETWQVIGDGFVARTIMSILLLPVAVFTAWLLQKRIEKVVAFDNSSSFWNIFHWSIRDEETVQFDYEDWSKLSAEKIYGY